MNRNRKQDADDDDDKDDDGFAAVSDKISPTSVKSSTNLKSVSSNANANVNVVPSTTSTKQRQKGSTDRTFNELIAGDGDEKPTRPAVANRTNVKDRKERRPVYLHPPPAFSKKTYAIGFILGRMP